MITSSPSMPLAAAETSHPDYARIAEAIAFIVDRAERQPTLEEIAGHLHLSSFHCQRLFSRWTGITPKRFLQVLTLERAKHLLGAARPLLDVSYAVGLSSGSRLHDHFVHLEAVTPGEYKSGGAGLTIEYAVHDTPFGQAFIATTPRGICHFAFLDDADDGSQLAGLRGQWPHAVFHENRQRTGTTVRTMFNDEGPPDRLLSLHVRGTNFQINVWKALLRIPPGTVASYAQVAAAIGHPRAARAVGLAAARNPVAFLIPCHRVIQGNGRIGGYHWGLVRKHAIHAWETARNE
jgi:AraC family transcriptional regulator, regulatory protein of adaptative response / methylated-DNA-[protein]-cysteine methyltransferase